MTRDEWLASDDPVAMLAWITGPVPDLGHATPIRRVSDRKLRLYACACWHAHFGDPEPYADYARADLAAVLAIEDGKEPPVLKSQCQGTEWLARAPAEAARAWAVHGGLGETAAALLREIIGDPFAPVAREHNAASSYAGPVLPARSVTRDVLGLASAIYEGRDWPLLPVLADALEDAGCDCGPLLRHLRMPKLCPKCGREHDEWSCAWCGNVTPRPAAHIRGCWALDLVLGKE